MTRRIISAVKHGATNSADERTPGSERREPRTYIDPSFVVEIDRMGQPVREFNDHIVVI